MHSHEVSFFKAPRYLLRKYNILAMLRPQRDIRTFLDVGCGAGELACTLAERGLAGVGIDFSAAAIKHGNTIRKQRGLTEDQITFKEGGLEQVKGKTFDLVICCEVLEHVENDKQLLRDFMAYSNKYLVISVPAKQKLFDASDKAVGHYRRYERDQLHQLLEGEGLEVLHLANYGFPFTNMVRIARKAAFAKKLRGNADDSMEDKSKESGINPVKLPGQLQRMDLEKPFKLVYQISRPFNSTDLAEGYVVLCRKR